MGNYLRGFLYYMVWGTEGPWITLVNGYNRSSSDFKLLAQRLVSAGFRVLSLDNRGSGKTQAASGFTIADMAQDVADLWELLAIKQTHLLGISMGGFIAQQLAVNHEKCLTSLILVSTAKDGFHIKDEEGWPSELSGIEEKLARYFAQSFVNKNKLLWKAMAKAIWQTQQEDGAEERAQAQRMAIAGYKGVDLSRLQVPTLLVHGSEDLIVPTQMAEDLVQKLPRGNLSLIEDAGHLLLAEKSTELAACILNFIAQID